MSHTSKSTSSKATSVFLITPQRFYENGLVHANKLLGENVFTIEDWNIIGEYVYDSEGARHQAFYAPKRDIHYKNICFKSQERIRVEQSWKFSVRDSEGLWSSSGLEEVQEWSLVSNAYGV